MRIPSSSHCEASLQTHSLLWSGKGSETGLLALRGEGQGPAHCPQSHDEVVSDHRRSCLQWWDHCPLEKQPEQESQAFCPTLNKRVRELVPGLLLLFGPCGVVLPSQELSSSPLIQADVQGSPNLGGTLQPPD